jgi:hypothetical protein
VAREQKSPTKVKKIVEFVYNERTSLYEKASAINYFLNTVQMLNALEKN